MGILGSGEGTLGLGGTKFDPRTWSAGGKSLADYGVDMTGSYNFDFQSIVDEYVKNFQAGLEQAAATTTANVEGVLADNNQPLADAEDKINANIAGINEDIETGIDENTHTLNQMENTINSNVADANVALGNLQAVVNDTSTIINQGLDASVNTNNPHSLVVNPQSWYDKNKEGIARGDWFFNSDEVSDTMAEKGGGFLKDVFQPQYDFIMGGAGGVVSELQDYIGFGETLASSLNQRPQTGLEGDPFGMEGPRRRDILEQKTFKDRGGGTAPSKINQGGYV